MLRKIDRILLRVPSLPSAVAYYRDALGMRLIRHEGKIASFSLGDGGAELVLHDDADLPAEATYFLVDDVRDLYQRRAALKLHFAGPPTPATRGYRATVKDPFGTVLLLIDRTSQGGGKPIIEDGKVADGLFSGVQPSLKPRRDLLIALYEKTGRTADDLPYTPHFESIYKAYIQPYGTTPPTREEAWRHLLNIRKRGILPKLGEARSTPPEVSDEALATLRSLIGKDIGKRDRLPYTKRFDSIVDEFNKTQPRPLSPHLVWRLVATLAK